MKNILVPVDFSEVTHKIIEQTIQIALPLKAKVHLIHVTEPSSHSISLQTGTSFDSLDTMGEHHFATVRYDIIRDQVAAKLKKEHSQLLELRKQLTDKKIDTHALLIEGHITKIIVKEASEINADMIILGSHGHGSLHDVFVGSVTNGIIKKLSCPVLIIPAK